jgi:hypothetical protein
VLDTFDESNDVRLKVGDDIDLISLQPPRTAHAAPWNSTIGDCSA